MQDDQNMQSRQSDPLETARANALLATLGRAERLVRGDALPPFFHQVYFWDPQGPEGLGRDGHPAVGAGLIPDMGLPRRMWAGGDLRFHAPLLAGVAAEKRSRRVSAVRKTGRSGPLALVTLEHEIWQDGSVCVTDRQDLIYRAEVVPGAPQPVPPKAPDAAVVTRDVRFDPTLLFRYSALTFNGHRIHYDAPYARDVEGYAGLVVHGPLLAQMMMLLIAEQGPLRRFAFRATAPLTADEPAALCLSDARAWVRGAAGTQHMIAEYEV